MGEEFKLAADSRTDKEKANALRTAGWLPAVVYGGKSENQNLKIKALDFQKVFEAAGTSSLINLNVNGGEPVKVVVKAVDVDPVKASAQHVDFYRVDMKKKITVEVPLEFVGEAKAVTELGGVLAKTIDSLEITCLPDKLISELTVDVSSLATMDDVIKVGDLKLPEGVELEKDPEEVVVSVVETVKEEEPVPAVPAEGAAPAEGEVPAAEGAAEEKKE